MNNWMRYYSLIFFCMVLTPYGFSQQSNIYTTGGKLLVDSAYSIDSKRLDDFNKIEFYVLPVIYNNTHYPDTALWNGISGTVIAKVTIDSTGKDHIKIVESSGYSFFENSVTLGINKSMKTLNRYTKSMKLPFEFYIPFRFKFVKDTFREDLKRNNAVTVRGRGEAMLIVPLKN